MALETNTYICIPLFVVLYLLTKHVLHKLIYHLPPTPFPILPLIGHLYLLKKPLHRSLAKLSDRYDPVLFLYFGSRCVLHVSSPLAADECLSTNDITFANRPRFLRAKHLGYNYTSLPWAPYGEHWQNLRCISSMEMLSSTRLDSLSHIRLQEIRKLTQRLFLAGGGKNLSEITLDLKSELFAFMLNVMTRMMGGKTFYGSDVGNIEEAKRFHDIVAETNQLNEKSNLIDMLPILNWFLAGKLEKTYAAMQKKRDDFMQEWVDEFRSNDLLNGEGEKPLLQVLLSLQEADPEYYTDKEIKSLSQALLHAGISTSVETMEWAMSLLLNNPHVLNKAQNEIENLVGCNRLVNESDLLKLSYLQCIIKETLRMHPAAPLLLPHESSKDCMVGGYRVPRGTMLFVNVWAIQNNPNIWDSPDIFRPERFEDKENVYNVTEGLTMMPFGSGRRRCLGENLALRIMGLALASLIQSFEWKRVSDELVNMTESSGFTAPKAKPLMAKYQTRPTLVSQLSKI